MARNQESEMSLVGHLTELRTRIIICLVALILSVVGAFFFSRPILTFLTKPIEGVAKEPGRNEVLRFEVGPPDYVLRLKDPRLEKINLEKLSQKRFEVTFLPNPEASLSTATYHYGDKASQTMYYSKPMDPIMMLLKVALIAGILIALPILLWQIWEFIKPGLKKKERKIIKPLLSGAIFLFPLGAGFAYFMITLILKVMQAYTVPNVIQWLNVSDYLSLLLNMMLIFGCIFEIPLALAIGSRIGVVTPAFLMRYRRHAYVILAMSAMIISPGADPFTMIAALFPLVVLYEVSIAISIPMARLHKRDQEEEDNEDEDDEEEKQERSDWSSGSEDQSTGNDDWATTSVDETYQPTNEDGHSEPSVGGDWNQNGDEESTQEGESTEDDLGEDESEDESEQDESEYEDEGVEEESDSESETESNESGSNGEMEAEAEPESVPEAPVAEREPAGQEENPEENQSRN